MNDTWSLINYFDVWGNAEEGWEVNNQCVEFDDLHIADDASDADLVEYLKSIGFLANHVSPADFCIEDGGDYIEFFAAESMEPICRLERNWGALKASTVARSSRKSKAIEASSYNIDNLYKLDERFTFDLEDEFEIYLDTSLAHPMCYVSDAKVIGDGAGISYNVVVAVPQEEAHWQMKEDVERNLERYMKEQTDGSDYSGWVQGEGIVDDSVLPDDVFQESKLYAFEVCVVPYDNMGPYGDFGVNAGILEDDSEE